MMMRGAGPAPLFSLLPLPAHSPYCTMPPESAKYSRIVCPFALTSMVWLRTIFWSPRKLPWTAIVSEGCAGRRRQWRLWRTSVFPPIAPPLLLLLTANMLKTRPSRTCVCGGPRNSDVSLAREHWS